MPHNYIYYITREADDAASGNAESQLGNEEDRRGGPRDTQSHEPQLGPSKRDGTAAAIFLTAINLICCNPSNRLADSLPADVLSRTEEELSLTNPQRLDAERSERLEAWLDAGHGSCALRVQRAADCVVDTWRRFDGERYDLIPWVVMPNQMHVLARVYEWIGSGRIVHSWKSYTGRRIAPLILESECRAGARRAQADIPGGEES